MGLNKKSEKSGRGPGGGGGANKADDKARNTKEITHVPEDSESTRRTCLHKQLRKTKFCMYHLQGLCQFGDSCAFAHSCDELQGAPDLRKTRLCRAFEGGICQDPMCTFAHAEEELRSTDMFYKTTLCMWFEKNACRNGEQCRFAHSVGELRSRAGGQQGPGPAVNMEKGKGAAMTPSPKPAGPQPQRKGKPLLGNGGRSGKGQAEGYAPAPAAYSGPGSLDYFSGAQFGGPAPGSATEQAHSREPMFVPVLPQVPLPPPPPPQALAPQAAQSRLIAGQLAQCSQQLEQLRAAQSQLQHSYVTALPNTAYSVSGGNGNEGRGDMEPTELSKLSQNISLLSEQLSRFEVQMNTRAPEQEADPAYTSLLTDMCTWTPTVAGTASPYPLAPLMQQLCRSHPSD